MKRSQNKKSITSVGLLCFESFTSLVLCSLFFVWVWYNCEYSCKDSNIFTTLPSSQWRWGVIFVLFAVFLYCWAELTVSVRHPCCWISFVLQWFSLDLYIHLKMIAIEFLVVQDFFRWELGQAVKQWFSNLLQSVVQGERDANLFAWALFCALRSFSFNNKEWTFPRKS